MMKDLDPLAALMAPYQIWCLRLAGAFVSMAALDGSHANERSVPVPRVVTAADAGARLINTKDTHMWMTAGGRRFAVMLADTDAARAFVARLPMMLDMTDLNGNEKKFDLLESLPANPSRPGTIRSGDLMLWGDNTVVVFYMTFASPYAYTRLGQVNDPAGLAQVLGHGGVRVQFSAQE